MYLTTVQGTDDGLPLIMALLRDCLSRCLNSFVDHCAKEATAVQVKLLIL